jgi:ABC-type antimicrobial peptide transport system permease subunit
MTLWRLALRNLVYHWRGNLAVFVGVVVGTAVLTGALLVGDSLRGSLRRLTLERLGWVDQALVGPHFFRARVATGLPAERAEAAILLRATADRRRAGEGSVGRINLVGVAHRFDDRNAESGDGVVLSAALATALDLRPGDKVSFRVQKADDVPRESLLGRRDEANAFKKLTFVVTAVLPEDDPAGRFNLQPTPEPPRNAFVSLAALQDALDQPGRANALLIGGPRAGLAEAFRAALDIEDWGLRLTGPDDRVQALFERHDTDQDNILEASEWWKGRYHGRQLTKIPSTFASGILGKMTGDPLPRAPLSRERVETYFRSRYPYLSLESRQLILEPAIADAALEAADEAGLRAAQTLVYLCKLEAKGKPHIAGIVAALDPTLDAPLGPFLPDGKKALADDEIALLDWTIEPTLLPLKTGEKVTLTYKPPEHRPGKLPDKTADFRFAGTAKLAGAVDDPNLTPPFPGITDAELPSQWKLPFEDKKDPEWSTNIVRQEYGDPIFWGEQRTTPKAYITLQAGKAMWSSRFGDLTSIRLAPRNGSDLGAAAQHFREALRKRLDPEAGGLVLLPVKDDALKASAGGTDFAGLFLGFSFFLIAAALLLVGLLFRLNLDRRAPEVGLLMAAGYRKRTVRRLLEMEAGLLTCLGAAVGIGAALGYTTVLVRWLGYVWPGGTLRSFLRPAFGWVSPAIGFEASALASMLAIMLAVRGLLRLPPRALLAGQTSDGEDTPSGGRPRWAWGIAGFGAVGALALLVAGPFVKDHEAKAGTFFGAGALLLTAALATLSAWMRGSQHRTVEGGPFAVERLGIRNAARHPVRSLLTAGLLASAAFLLVAVEAFRRSADTALAGDHSPSGGFSLIAESDLPVLQDLGSDAGRAEARSKLVDFHLQVLGARRRAEAERLADDDLALLARTAIIPLRVRAGDDASCLNLYQPRRPRVFGVPADLIKRDGFTFADAPSGNAWQVLNRSDEPFAAIGEQNTVVWMLKSGRGKTLEVPDEKGIERKLRVEALLHDSVFQSGLLISEENFLKLYPNHAGYNFFLVAPPPGKDAQVEKALQAALADRGLEVTPTTARLQAYLEVENTYLSTFQALGGLGLLLGSLGLAVVLLRGVWERRTELALLRALGYRRGTLGRLVLAENGFLLLFGLAAGALSALLAVAPHLLGGAASIPWTNLAALLGLVLVVGLLAGALAVAATLRAPLIPALRRE